MTNTTGFFPEISFNNNKFLPETSRTNSNDFTNTFSDTDSSYMSSPNTAKPITSSTTVSELRSLGLTSPRSSKKCFTSNSPGGTKSPRKEIFLESGAGEKLSLPRFVYTGQRRQANIDPLSITVLEKLKLAHNGLSRTSDSYGLFIASYKNTNLTFQGMQYNMTFTLLVFIVKISISTSSKIMLSIINPNPNPYPNTHCKYNIAAHSKIVEELQEIERLQREMIKESEFLPRTPRSPRVVVKIKGPNNTYKVANV